MVFNTGSALLDAIVLAVVSKDGEGTYGYRITQDVRQAIEISESTLYPVPVSYTHLDVYKRQGDTSDYYETKSRCRLFCRRPFAFRADGLQSGRDMEWQRSRPHRSGDGQRESGRKFRRDRRSRNQSGAEPGDDFWGSDSGDVYKRQT